MEAPATFAGRGHSRLVALVRAVPIRWRILSIAALNSAVVVVLVALIWNGVQVLGSAWDDVRQARESDNILARLESETGHLQNLIHRYINQPSPEMFAEISHVRETMLGTLTTRASTDPMLSGSVERLERVTERFLNGFSQLSAVQATITKTYEDEVLTPARDMAGLYSIIEGATGHRDALIWPSLGKSREAFTTMLVAANSYYLSLATASAEEASRNIETIQQTIPVMIDLADNDLQRMALQRLNARSKALGEGLAKLSAQLTNRTELLRDAIDASQAEASGAIDELSVKMRRREQRAQETFDQTLADISRKVLSIAVIFLGHHHHRRRFDRAVDPPAVAADHDVNARDHLRRLQSQSSGHRRQRRGRRDGARGGSVPRKRHRQAEDRRRITRLQGKGGERAARAQCGAAEPDRRRTSGGARRPGRGRGP